jgi:hypothetical protein
MTVGRCREGLGVARQGKALSGHLLAGISEEIMIELDISI